MNVLGTEAKPVCWVKLVEASPLFLNNMDGGWTSRPF